MHHTPARYIRADGSSRPHPQARIVYTTQALFDADARLLAARSSTGGPTVTVATIAAVADADLPGRGHGLSVDQALAVEKIAISGRALDVLVGQAGTGKSFTMAGLRTDTENTAKWLTEWRRVPALVARRDRPASRLARHPHPSSSSSRSGGQPGRPTHAAGGMR